MAMKPERQDSLSQNHESVSNRKFEAIATMVDETEFYSGPRKMDQGLR